MVSPTSRSSVPAKLHLPPLPDPSVPCSRSGAAGYKILEMPVHPRLRGY